MWNPDILKALNNPEDYISPGYHLARGYKMRRYQVRAAHKVFAGQAVVDADFGFTIPDIVDGTNVHIDMGLGKTIIGLTALADWFRYNILSRPILIIAPLRVCQTVWRQEAKAWSHTCHLRIGTLIGNERDRAFELARAWDVQTKTRGYEALLCNPEKLPWLIKYLRNDWSFFDGLIIDDVALRDPKSKQFKILSNYGVRTALKGQSGKAIRDHLNHLVMPPPHRFKRGAKLTGTPSTSGLHTLWAPNYLMDHGRRLMRDFPSFEGRFFHKGAQVAKHVSKLELNKEEGEATPLYEARDGAPRKIHELIADITIELNAEDYGVLPQTLGDASKSNLDETTPTHIHRVELPREYRDKYDILEREAIIELSGNTLMAQNGGAKSMMCWQMANGAIYTDDQFGNKLVEPLHSAKVDKLVELIDQANTNIIVPYYFQHDFARIVERLEKEKMAWASLKGRNAERTVTRWNNGQIPILLLHPQSAAHGLNLQFGGHTLIWFTMLWSLERYLQTNARLARSGQAGLVNIHHIVTTRTTDELMLINLRQNGSDQERFRAALRQYQRIRGIDFITQGI